MTKSIRNVGEGKGVFKYRVSEPVGSVSVGNSVGVGSLGLIDDWINKAEG